MDFITTATLLIVGLVLLVWGADRFIEASSKIAIQLGVSELVIGLTLVAFGTSAPEVSVGVASVINNNANIAAGTIIGSNIANIGLIFGVTLFAFVGTKDKATLPLVCFGLSVVLLFFALNDLKINLYESLGFLIILILFLYGLDNKDTQVQTSPNNFQSKEILFALISLVALIAGAQLTVENAEKLALSFGISETIIGLTIIAVGTSLPELAASLAALYKQKGQMIIGNILGSNVFNIVTVMPIIGFSLQTNIDPQLLQKDIWYLFALTGIFIIVTLLQSKLSKTMLQLNGGLLVGIYCLYIFTTFV